MRPDRRDDFQDTQRESISLSHNIRSFPLVGMHKKKINKTGKTLESHLLRSLSYLTLAQNNEKIQVG